MNILHLTTHVNAGGITSYLYLLGQKLRREGHKVFVISSGGEILPKFLEAGIEHQTMNIRTKSELDPRIYFAARQLCDFVKENKIDVIHAHTRITQVMGWLLGQWTKTRYVSTCHGYFKTRIIRRIFPCWGEAVIAISKAVAQHLKDDFHIPQQKIFMIHNGIDVEQFPLIEGRVRFERRKEFNLNGAEPIVGIIARLSDVKGHAVLIKAMSRIAKDFPQSKLMIVGQGREEGNLRKLVKEMNLSENVVFLPTVGRPAEVLPLFDIFVLPSYKEGLSLSLVEAQMSGLPVVATRVGGIPEAVLDGKTGLLIDPGNVEDLIGAIFRLLRDRNLAEAIGAEAHRFAVQEFSADRMGKETLKFYERLLSSKWP